MSSIDDQTDGCAYVVGDDGLNRWSGTSAHAWTGLLQAHRQITRELDSELERQHGLGLSGLELLGRLAAADRQRARLSALAEQVSLSLSRVSRIIDTLQARGLVERQPCPNDARATNAWLTPAGLELVRAAQATHFAGVQRRFFDRLTHEQVAALAAAFACLTPPSGETAGGSERAEADGDRSVLPR